MKRYDEHNEDELLALTDEQINALIDLECALDGAPLLPPLPEKPVAEKHEPDLTMYEVAGFHFKHQQDALAVANTINSRSMEYVDYDWQNDGRVHHIPAERELVPAAVTAKQVFSTAAYEKIKPALAAYQAANNTYERLKKQYDEASKKRERHRNVVWDRVEEMRERREQRSGALQTFDRYMKLADGETHLALRFFRAAHPGDDKFLTPEILAAAYMPQAVEEAK